MRKSLSLWLLLVVVPLCILSGCPESREAAVKEFKSLSHDDQIAVAVEAYTLLDTPAQHAVDMKVTRPTTQAAHEEQLFQQKQAVTEALNQQRIVYNKAQLEKAGRHKTLGFWFIMAAVALVILAKLPWTTDLIPSGWAMLPLALGVTAYGFGIFEAQEAIFESQWGQWVFLGISIVGVLGFIAWDHQTEPTGIASLFSWAARKTPIPTKSIPLFSLSPTSPSNDTLALLGGMHVIQNNSTNKA